MPFDNLLINYMRVTQVAAGDVWGEPEESADVKPPIPCRIMYDTRLMKDYKQ